MSDAITPEELMTGTYAALVLRQPLAPVEGPDGVFFPATFAATEDGKFPGGYNIDTIGRPDEGKNICLVDSVGSQANRVEPLFATEGYQGLVPQITVKAGSRTVSLLEAGHRAADAIVRCSALQEQLQAAFKALQSGDAQPLAKIAPTSLVFGVWDSRDTQAKAPRLIASTIRAFDVSRLTRSAQFNPAVDYVAEGALDEPTDKKVADEYASWGFVHVPASASHGGVTTRGEIRRETTLHLAALRLLRSKDAPSTQGLQQYLLGLALVAFTAPATGFLRQGCNLVPAEGAGATVIAVGFDGKRTPIAITHAQALAFAKQKAEAFGVGPSRAVEFDQERAKKSFAEGDVAKKAKKAKKEKAQAGK